MKLLLIGGTRFVGRAIAAEALARGHELTLFHRGQSNPGLFPEAEHLLGDRNGDLSLLDGRSWDVVVDTSGYFPRQVRMLTKKLAGRIDRYVFISSISVYADTHPPTDESSPVATIEDETVEEITSDTYGALKALCEQAAEEILPGQTLIIRPGLIVGPHDPTDRFTYWPARVAAGGEVLAPGRPEAPVQFIDTRDLAVWTLDMAEREATGVYNADSPAGQFTMGQLLETCREVSGSDAVFRWAADDVLLAQGVGPWVELPLWLPDTPEYAGFMEVDCRKAAAAGLTIRPLADTVRDTLEWHHTRTGEMMKSTLSPKKERRILEELAANR